MSLSRRLREEHAPMRARCESHPFVLGMGDGTLPHEFFVRWVAQDWLYLQGYLAVVQLAADLSDETDARARWLEMARLTRDVELDLHRGLAREVGLSETALAETEPYRATAQYLETLGAASTYPEVVATLTPCAVGYTEIARCLGALPRSPVPRYAAWIDAYQDPAFQDVTAWLEVELDRSAPGYETLVEDAYAATVRCELNLWDALWNGA